MSLVGTEIKFASLPQYLVHYRCSLNNTRIHLSSILIPLPSLYQHFGKKMLFGKEEKEGVEELQRENVNRKEMSEVEGKVEMRNARRERVKTSM